MESKKKIVLIVEDEVSLRHVLKEKLKIEGFDVFSAQNGLDALKEVGNIHPDIILLDVSMPKMSGLEFLHKMREDVQNRDIKVIMLTNLNTGDAIMEALQEGGYSYLVKSDWTLEQIVEKIKNELNF